MEELVLALRKLEKAYKRLIQALEKYDAQEIDIALDASIQRFEFTFELSWKTIKRFAKYLGFEECNSPRSCIKLAYKLGWISNQEQWLNLLEARNLTSHTYDLNTAWEVYELIKSNHTAFKELINHLHRLIKENS
ncbi:MAG: HI0074 family nucleotidyltransferase substrate-binding subunit [Aquificota bacterium]|jgi:nucleotidyltransferase substrate binding protein (TIGR01987 family)